MKPLLLTAFILAFAINYLACTSPPSIQSPQNISVETKPSPDSSKVQSPKNVLIETKPSPSSSKPQSTKTIPNETKPASDVQNPKNVLTESKPIVNRNSSKAQNRKNVSIEPKPALDSSKLQSPKNITSKLKSSKIQNPKNIPIETKPLFDLSEAICTGNSTEIHCFESIKYIATKAECSCSLIPQKPKKKKISFSDEVKVQVIPSETQGVYWIKEKDLFKVYEEKSQIFNNKQTYEFLVLDMVAAAIQKSHRVFENIYRFLVRVDGFEVYLSQTKVKINENTTIDFPSSEIFRVLEGNKEYFKELANSLLNSMRPAYEINEHLLNLLKNLDETKMINPNLFKAMSTEAITMNMYYDDLTNKIQQARMELYNLHLKDIRMQTQRLEFQEISLSQANQNLYTNLKSLKKLEAGMNYYLKLALTIDFAKLHEATAKFYDLANKAIIKKQQ